MRLITNIFLTLQVLQVFLGKLIICSVFLLIFKLICFLISYDIKTVMVFLYQKSAATCGHFPNMVNKAQPRASRWNLEQRQFIQFESNYTFTSQSTAFILQMCKRVAHLCIK
jgi:hypothetical protein